MTVMQHSELYGRAEIEPKGPLIAGTMHTLRITFTVGRYGIDDKGSILIAWKYVCDDEHPQFSDPEGSGYTTAYTTGEAKLKLSFGALSFYRPWFKALRVDVYDGSLKEGDKIIVTLGDRSRGGPGLRIQTFQESERIFKVLADPFGTRRYVEVESPKVTIIGGPADELQVVAPSIVTPREPFAVTVRALDSWGNPSPSYRGEITFTQTEQFDSLPSSYVFKSSDRGVKRFEGISLKESGLYRLEVVDSSGLKAVSNPILCRSGEVGWKVYWGDLHGQTHGKARDVLADTVGTGTPREYFEFARDVAAIDFCSWQGNDFQVSKELWEDVCAETKRFNQPGRFVTFLGYEWSGLTPNGGDHNILYLEDDQPIYRSSHYLVKDKSDIDTDRCPISELWKTFKGRKDVMAIPHVGGRYGNLDYFDPEFISLIEIHSFHGTFEWFAREALERGLKVGFVAFSDDHTCRPGLAYPPCRPNKVKGGLTAVYADELTRRSIWEALKSRRCYGTTGARILLHVDVNGHMMGEEFSTEEYPKIKVEVHGTNLINRVQVYRGTKPVYTYPPFRPKESGFRVVQILWSGARSKGRSKRTVWNGMLSLDKGKIIRYETLGFRKRVDLIEEYSNQILKWYSSTVGNYKGLVLWLDAPDDAEITFKSQPKTFKFKLKNLREKPIVVDAGGVDQKIEVCEVSPEDWRMDISFEYVDEEVEVGVNPYWVRVQQVDCEMAWSSPVYVHYKTV